MQTQNLFVLIHIWNKAEVGTIKLVLAPHPPCSKIFYRLFQDGASFVDHACYLCFMFVMFSCLFIAAFLACWLQLCGYLLGKGWLLGSFIYHAFWRMWCPCSGLVLDYKDRGKQIQTSLRFISVSLSNVLYCIYDVSVVSRCTNLYLNKILFKLRINS